jgi:hypothetical protein
VKRRQNHNARVAFEGKYWTVERVFEYFISHDNFLVSKSFFVVAATSVEISLPRVELNIFNDNKAPTQALTPDNNHSMPLNCTCFYNVFPTLVSAHLQTECSTPGWNMNIQIERKNLKRSKKVGERKVIYSGQRQFVLTILRRTKKVCCLDIFQGERKGCCLETKYKKLLKAFKALFEEKN